jgi:iron(III) transport system substrate-binding protein
MRHFRCLRFAGVVVLIAAVLPAPARADELAGSVVDGAKKEREVVILGGIPGQALRPLRELLEKRYDVRITSWHGDSEEFLKGATADLKNARPNFDVVVGSDAIMAGLDAKGFFEPFEPPSARNYPKQFLVPSRRMTPWRVFAFGINYNTQRLGAEQAPKTWEDLLDTKWRRKFFMPNPALHAPTLQFLLNLEKLLGPKWRSAVEGLAKQRPRLTRDPAEEVPPLASGELPLAIGYTKDKYQFGGPIDYVKMDKYLASPSYVAVARRAPHPNAARLFVDFFLGPESQQLIGNLGDYVLHPDVPDRFENDINDDQLVPMRLPSPSERETWTKKFREIFK